MQKCLHCGTENQDDFMVCHKCWRPLGEKPSEKPSGKAAKKRPARGSPAASAEAQLGPRFSVKRALAWAAAAAVAVAVVAYTFIPKPLPGPVQGIVALMPLGMSTDSFTALAVDWQEVSGVLGEELPRSLENLARPLGLMEVPLSSLKRVYYYRGDGHLVICETELSESELLRKIYLADYEKQEGEAREWFYNVLLAPEAVAAIGNSLYYGNAGILKDALRRHSGETDPAISSLALELAEETELYSSFVALSTEYILLPEAGTSPYLVSGQVLDPEKASLRLVGKLRREREIAEKVEELETAIGEAGEDTRWKLQGNHSLRNWLILELEASGELDIFSAELIGLRI